MPTYCLNCNSPRHKTAAYCTDCGQAYKDVNLSFWQVAIDFLTNVFAFDNKLWRTLYAMLYPARLATYYVAGKRKSYISPGRLFFIGLVIHIATLSLLLRAMEDDVSNNSETIYQQAEQIRLASLYDSIAISYIADTAAVDTFKQRLFDIDTDTSEVNLGDIDLISAIVSQYEIESSDLATLDADYIINKYEIQSFWDRVLIRQGIRVNSDIVGLLKSLVGNLFWLIAVMVFLTAVVLKLLYLRHHIYLAEHLTLSAYTHAWQLMVGSILCAGLVGYCFAIDDLSHIIDLLEESYAIIAYVGILALYAIVAIKVYYQENWLITLVKWAVSAAAYLFAGLVVFVVISMITMFLF